MLLENESELRECKANVFFQRIRLRQPVWSYTPITIIRIIAWAGISVHKPDLFFYHVLRVLLFVNYLRFGQFYEVFPPDNETKNNTK